MSLSFLQYLTFTAKASTSSTLPPNGNGNFNNGCRTSNIDVSRTFIAYNNMLDYVNACATNQNFKVTVKASVYWNHQPVRGSFVCSPKSNCSLLAKHIDLSPFFWQLHFPLLQSTKSRKQMTSMTRRRTKHIHELFINGAFSNGPPKGAIFVSVETCASNIFILGVIVHHVNVFGCVVYPRFGECQILRFAVYCSLT